MYSANICLLKTILCWAVFQVLETHSEQEIACFQSGELLTSCAQDRVCHEVLVWRLLGGRSAFSGISRESG